MTQREEASMLYEYTGARLWRDECKTPFILTRYMEIYVYGKDKIGAYCWSMRKYNHIKRQYKPISVRYTDDGMCFAIYPLSSLVGLASIGAFKRRPYKNGSFMLGLESKLGHKIYPYNPSFVKPKPIPEHLREHLFQPNELIPA